MAKNVVDRLQFRKNSGKDACNARKCSVVIKLKYYAYIIIYNPFLLWNIFENLYLT